MTKSISAVFPYRRNPEGQIFPVIPLRLYSGRNFVDSSALIDSGATISIFRPEMAERLGIKIDKGREVYLTGVGGRIKGFLHQLKVEIGGKQFLCPVIFSYEFTVSFSLLGREEFFKRFRIVFEEKNRIVKLE